MDAVVQLDERETLKMAPTPLHIHTQQRCCCQPTVVRQLLPPSKSQVPRQHPFEVSEFRTLKESSRQSVLRFVWEISSCTASVEPVLCNSGPGSLFLQKFSALSSASLECGEQYDTWNVKRS